MTLSTAAARLAAVPDLDASTDRLRQANLAVVAGFERAVKILRPDGTLGAHYELLWYEQQLVRARRMTGLPSLGVVA